MRCLARVFAAPKGKPHLGRARFPVTLTDACDGGDALCSFVTAVKDWARLFRDLGRIFRPVLLIAAILAVLLAVAFSRGLLS